MAVVQGALDRGVDGGGLLGESERVLQHERGAENGADGVRLALTGDVGRAAVARLVEALHLARPAPSVLAGEPGETGGRQHAERSGEDGGLVRDDVAEHVLHDHHVETRGACDEDHRAGVDQLVLELDVRVVLRDLDGDLAPEAGRLEDVRLVDGGQLLAAGAGELEADAQDALDLLLGVEERVDALASGLRLPALLGRGVVEAAGELAQDDHVRAAHAVVLERARGLHAGEDLHGADVGVQAERLAQAEDGGLRADRLVVPLGAADRAEEHRVRAAGGADGLVAQGRAVGVDRASANHVGLVAEVVLPARGDGVQHLLRCAGDLRADAVARQNHDVESGHVRTSGCRRIRGGVGAGQECVLSKASIAASFWSVRPMSSSPCTRFSLRKGSMSNDAARPWPSVTCCASRSTVSS